MNDIIKNGVGAAFVVAVISPIVAKAQDVPTGQETPRTIPGLVIAAPTPVPTKTPVPVPVPVGPVLGLPVPTPSASPADTAPTTSISARKPVSSPTRSATTRSASIPTPTATPTTAASTTPVIPAAVAPSAVASPTVEAPSPVTAAPATEQGGSNWPWLAGGATPVILALIAWAMWRRRSRVEEAIPVYEQISPEVVTAVPVAPVRPVGPRARIDMVLRPTRAGLNMLSATVEAEVVIRNLGEAPASQVRVHATLLSAHAGQDADLATTFAAANGRPAAPPFTLAPGEERRVRIVAALSREAVRSMDAGGRPMFVPLVVIDVRYGADAVGTPGRTGQAFAVGIERVDSAKLAPFWLDGSLRMHDQIAARAQGGAVIA